MKTTLRSMRCVCVCGAGLQRRLLRSLRQTDPRLDALGPETTCDRRTMLSLSVSSQACVCSVCTALEAKSDNGEASDQASYEKRHAKALTCS